MPKQTSKSKKTQNRKAPAAQARRPRLDDNARLDIAGVVISALGLILLVAISSQNSGIATESIAWFFKIIFGMGAFVFPGFLIFWGLSFFLPKSEIHEARVAVGLGTIFISIISLIALYMPFDLIFDAETVIAYGGFVGSGIAWALFKLSGTAISTILLVTFILVGLVVTGLSFSGLIARFSDWWDSRKSLVPERPQREKVQRTQNVEFRRSKPLERKPEDPTIDEVPVIAPATVKIEKKKTPSIADDKTVAIKASAAPRKLEGFELPSPKLLKLSSSSSAESIKNDQRVARETAEVITDTLNTFDVPSRVVDWIIGPTLTLFKIEIAKGVRLNKITALDNDLALALAASSLRILAPIPGESLVGIEVPNALRASVTLGDVLLPAGEGGPLDLAIGKDVSGKNVTMDLTKMPHLLIAGTTGSGKSVAINSMIMSILMRSTPAEVRLILIDPKRVEMTLYRDIPHLYIPVVTEATEANAALSWAVTEMERRLKLFSRFKVRNIGEYYEYLASPDSSEDDEELPYLVIVIDELADLMMVAGKDVEASIVRIAQLARAAGIHLIVATQRPEATIVTGLIKTNITHRIAFNVGSSMDSRVILDENGAEKLTGLGDMLYSKPDWAKPKRIQGCYVSSEEVQAVADNLKAQKDPEYHSEILEGASSGSSGSGGSANLSDEYLWDAAELVVASGMGSTSGIQRRFSIGYARAGRIMDTLTELNIVGPPDGSKPREILVNLEQLESIKLRALGLEDDSLGEYESDFE